MKILGVNSSHISTACLLIDGEIKSSLSEERLSRVKNQKGLPTLAIKEILKINKLKSKDIDLLIFGSKDPKTNSGFASFAGVNSNITFTNQTNLSHTIKKIAWDLRDNLLVRIPSTRYFYDNLLPIIYKFFIDRNLMEMLLQKVEKEIEIPREKVKWIDHHTAHAYSAIFTSHLFGNKSLLALTLDGMGDGLCSTVRTVKGKKIKLLAQTPQGNSLGELYAFTTQYLGMKMGEDEYKVMGLASYATEKYVERIYLKLKRLIWVNKDLTFSTRVHSFAIKRVLSKIYKHERFDSVAGAIQKLLENLAIEWVKLAVKKSGIRDLVCSGGVFMNVKLNQKIVELSEVNSLYVVPSSGDETTAWGAAYFGYENFLNGDIKKVKHISHLYLGTSYSDELIRREINKLNVKKYRVKKFPDIERRVAALLSEFNVVARFEGKMEFGARALGNRSILAHPASLDAIKEINESIKSRDFWMPFAPSILQEREKDYIKNPKNYPAYFMTITFESMDKGKKDLKAAMHQSDFTLRPQIVREDANQKYYKLIKEFERLTEIGALLNTSFNLHGHPIVMSPKDALEVLDKSGLKYLALGNYLIHKI